MLAATKLNAIYEKKLVVWGCFYGGWDPAPNFLWRFWEKPLWGSLFYTTQDDSWKVWEVFFVAHVLRCAPWLRRMPLDCNPIGSMGLVYLRTFGWCSYIFTVNVGKYTLHGPMEMFSLLFFWIDTIDVLIWMMLTGFRNDCCIKMGNPSTSFFLLICSHWFA